MVDFAERSGLPGARDWRRAPLTLDQEARHEWVVMWPLPCSSLSQLLFLTTSLYFIRYFLLLYQLYETVRDAAQLERPLSPHVLLMDSDLLSREKKCRPPLQELTEVFRTLHLGNVWGVFSRPNVIRLGLFGFRGQEVDSSYFWRPSPEQICHVVICPVICFDWTEQITVGFGSSAELLIFPSASAVLCAWIQTHTASGTTVDLSHGVSAQGFMLFLMLIHLLCQVVGI